MTKTTSDNPAALYETWLETWGSRHPEIEHLLRRARSVHVPRNRGELFRLAMAGQDKIHEVAYKVKGHGRVVEAHVVNCRNGVAVNYTDPYMRRRDPQSMMIADEKPTDKPLYVERFGSPFASVREEIFDWLAQQDLIVFPFSAGGGSLEHDALFIGPANAGFFAAALADLQGMIDMERKGADFDPRAVIYLAPPFRHTHCEGKQIVVHNRLDEFHEVFSLNLYPGPSAKKGVYSILLNRGESEGWVTAHASTVRVITPYDNIVTIMHEGASGGGKSEMLEYPHREHDGRIRLGVNVVTGERRHVALHQNCRLEPVTDDMALCHPEIQGTGRKLAVTDAEAAWFVRVDHVNCYGVNPDLESICVNPPEPLIFLNLRGVANATCLIWEHTEDAPGKPCSNPRVILPRDTIPHIVKEPVMVDVRSFGVRTPPCTLQKPSYGILGMLHMLPPALAWIWRLVAPRGYANPSIISDEGLASEGVGSFWPFATGLRVDYADLIFDQMRAASATRYVLMPNQHIGAWKVGFNAQWLAREYLARRGGAQFRPEQIAPARCALLGHAMQSMQIEGYRIPNWFLKTETQPEIGLEGYDTGAAQLTEFFKQELSIYNTPNLSREGRRIIECCLDDGSVPEYEDLSRAMM